MPLAQYNKKNRYKYINYFEVVDNTLFDAYLPSTLCITTSQHQENNKNYVDFLFATFDKRYEDYYRWNRNNYKGITFVSKRNVSYLEFNNDLDFILGRRAINHKHCISTTNKGFDYYWNVLRKNFENNWVSDIAIISFKSKEERDNFTTFVYSNKGEYLISTVFLGTHSMMCSKYTLYAIPQIDWSEISNHSLWKEGRYDEAVLDTMGLKWEGDKIVEIR